ncbi:MAG: AEC family transporter, partial [Planctomycetes bacterium]|nr:AEC family transporter [Planctomycetota bacterium]
VVAILFVLTGVQRLVPALALDVTRVLGAPTMVIGLLVAGCQISKLGRKALRFDGWNIAIGVIRNLLVPGLMFLVALALRGRLPTESLMVFCIVAATPGSINSVNLAFKYESDPRLAAEGVIFTHLFALVTMIGFMVLMERFIM